MQFWGCEVNHGKALQVAHQEGMYVHVTQAALGPDPKEGERVLLEMVVAGKPFVLGTLKKGTCDQIHLDLVLDTDFALRHSGSRNVFFTGYMTLQEYMHSDDEEGMEESDEDDDDEDLELEGKSSESEEEEEEEAAPKAKEVKINGAAVKAGKATAGKPVQAAKKAAAQAAAEEPDKFKRMVLAKAKSFDMEPPGGGAGGLKDPDVEDEDDEMEEDDFGDEDDSEEDDEDEEGEDEDEEDESEEEEELTPVAKPGKRPAETPVKTPVPAKKTKAEAAPTPTPKKPAAKEGKPTPAAKPTPTPAKSASKPEPQSADKGNATPGKKLGAHKCADCDRAFATETALSQHSQSKHKK